MSWFSEEMNKFDGFLAQLSKRRKEMTQKTRIRDEQGNMTKTKEI